MKINIYVISLISLLGFLTGCKKVIQINLNNSSAQYVIEGNITNNPGPYTVSITRTVNFSETNQFPGISGALVIIIDKTGLVADTLKETSAGKYQTSQLQGIAGHTYTLSITLNGKSFTASSSMPMLVPFDSLYESRITTFGRNIRISVVPVYNDPPGIVNYYHFAIFQNSSPTNAIFVRNDLLTDGNKVAQPLTDGKLDLSSGDRVTIDMQCIDASVYEYYFSLEQTINQDVTSPANPVSNISGNALGYFSAHTSQSKTITIR